MGDRMETRKAVVTGAAGMLGTALLDLAPVGWQVVGVDLPDGDITVLEGARHAMARHEPGTVIHCAAYTDVDGCSRDPDRAMLVNGIGTGNVAAVCAEMGAHLIVLSTDYVFDGEKGEPYVEGDAPRPISPYGESKLRGEILATERHDRVLVLRTQWLYGPSGRNFVRTVTERARALGALRVVADEYGSPTYTRDLAESIWQLAALGSTGIAHCVNQGVCSWADLARAALCAAGCGQATVEDISWRDWPSPTRRPRFSALGSTRLPELGLRLLRPWQEAVHDYASRYLPC
jgi:dTDP-4-dehydrorhamnose reductase